MFSQELITRLKKARSVVVLTGAGISAESGIPTFRGQEGLWKKYRAEELANVEAFHQNPHLVWEWYEYRRSIIQSKAPNPAHFALAHMEQYYTDFVVITQNVDGFHRAAGNRKVLEIHGNILRSRCVECHKIYNSKPYIMKDHLPQCECGGLLRPDVVWFGEALSEDLLKQSYQAAQSCEVFFSIGTSSIVQPAASFPVVAKNHGAYLVEINVETTPLSSIADEVLLGKVGEILPELVEKAELLDK